MRDALHLTGDQELPACRRGAVLQDGNKAGIQPAHAERLANRLQLLDFARSPQDMDMPGWGLHPLTGELKSHWAIRVSGNWRLTFAFEKEDAILVDYQDYH